MADMSTCCSNKSAMRLVTTRFQWDCTSARKGCALRIRSL